MSLGVEVKVAGGLPWWEGAGRGSGYLCLVSGSGSWWQNLFML